MIEKLRNLLFHATLLKHVCKVTSHQEFYNHSGSVDESTHAHGYYENCKYLAAGSLRRPAHSDRGYQDNSCKKGIERV